MIDLSNNNGGTIDWKRLYQAGQRRVYDKVTEGTEFVDAYYQGRRAAAKAAGFKVGGYHFAHPHTNTPAEELAFFLKHLGKLVKGKDLRPALDVEQGAGGVLVGKWVQEFAKGLHAKIGVTPLVYSYASYLDACHLTTRPGPLWLASYGRNDGIEHPYTVPKPWTGLTAHQYASTKTMAGITGEVDISKVYNFANLELP